MVKESSGKEKKITFNIKKEENFSEWFSEIIKKAELADIRYNVKGFVVFMPWAVRCMEKVYDLLEEELQSTGHEPAWFPSVIPERNFKLEGEHIKGFSPQVFWVTHGADTKLDERMALRPTSETAMYQMYALWIQGYTDLPFKMYQRAQVWRYETKATRPFIRSREFYWIEGHDCFATEEEAEKQVLEDIRVTEKVMHKKLGVPFLALRRPEWDKFPGAVYTIGSDSLMPDGKVIQQPSTHFLGQGFAKVFNIKFTDKDGKERYVWQTCYGPAVSRILASVISIHGDDNGLVLPYNVAPIQVLIVPIYTTKNKKGIMKKAEKIKKDLIEKDIRVKIDDSEKRPGEKFFFWEMKGVPFRIEIGEKEVKTGKLTLFLRDVKKRATIHEKKIAEEIKKEGEAFDERLRKKADIWFKTRIIDCKSKEELERALQGKKIARCDFCSISKEGEKCAEVVEKQLLASVRGVRHDKFEKASGKCIFCGRPAKHVVYIAKSY
ncbi:MAG: proline--tRNA ligase [Candidatus Pacearchaeota archaeon]|nr:proline--tRNA ligase [Candidatus Pacearchaeota archaeon]